MIFKKFFWFLRIINWKSLTYRKNGIVNENIFISDSNIWVYTIFVLVKVIYNAVQYCAIQY